MQSDEQARTVVINNIVALNTGDAAILDGIRTVLAAARIGPFTEQLIDKQATAVRKYYPQARIAQQFLGAAPKPGLLRKLMAKVDRAGIIPRLRNRRGWLASRHPAGRFLLERDGRRNRDMLVAADLIVSTGGTYLVENYDMTSSLAQLALAAQSKAPVVMFTQSLGPFAGANNRARLRHILPQIDLILLRDAKSLGYLKELGVPLPQARIVPDAAFALADPARIETAKHRSLAAAPHVAISVRYWAHFHGDRGQNGYFEAIRDAATWLVRDKGADVTFLSTCQGVPEYWIDDSRAAAEIVASLPDDVRRHVRINSAFHTPKALMQQLAGFDLVVATRMHMAILSLCSGTPVVPIAYEFKTKELFAGMGFPTWTQDIDTMTGDALVAAIDNYLQILPVLRPRLMDAVLENHIAAMAVGDLIRQVMIKPS